MNNVLNEISASKFLENGYSLAPVGYDVYDNVLYPAYTRLMTYKSDEAIFSTPLSTISFYRDLKQLYETVIDVIGNVSCNRYLNSYVRYNAKFQTLVNDLIANNVPMDPVVKLFFEDFYGFLVLDKKGNGLQHIFLCDRRLKDFHPRDARGIKIGLDKIETKKTYFTSSELEIHRILLKLGTANTLALMKILMCIAINYIINKNIKYLDELIPNITHIRSIIGMAANDAEWGGAGGSGGRGRTTPGGTGVHVTIPPIASPISHP